jgi:hypothetical protein
VKNFTILLFSLTLLLVANDGQAKAAGFNDVTNFKDQIEYLSDKGIINGYGDGTFGPLNEVTRGDAALMIARALSLDTTPRDTKFPDVKKDKAASGAIQSAADRGIIQGYTDGTFGLNDSVKRGEMAIFIARAFELTDEEVISFTDVAISSPFYSSIRKILAFGVTEGYDSGKFLPGKSLNRGEFSALLARAMDEKFTLPVDVCGYDSDSRENPDRQTINCLLTRSALDAGIPPEIVKAVTTQENGDWKHYVSKGVPDITEDGGIGLMQITSTEGYDVNLLKYDINYNISAGVEMLKNKFNLKVLPSVGDNNPMVLQSWYFAVMAYNGAVAENSPVVKATGERNTKAYQEKVFDIISKSYYIANITPMIMAPDDFRYDETTGWNIKFIKSNFPLSKAEQTQSKEIYGYGDSVKYTGSGLRSKPSSKDSNSNVTVTTGQDTFTIVGGLVYDIDNAMNLYGWYPAKVVKNGKTIYGYIASPYIKFFN